MTWLEITYGLRTKGEFIRLEGGTLDIGIVRGFTADDEPPDGLFSEMFKEIIDRHPAPTEG